MSRRARLRTALTTFEPADVTERAYQRQMLALCDVPGDPFSRTHWDPGHFTASVFALSSDVSALLLIFHRKLRLWVQPGGHVDPDDVDVFAAARRELGEECGLVDVVGLSPGPFDLDVHAIPPLGGSPAHEHHDVRYAVRVTHDALRPSDEVVDARWVPLAEVGSVQTDESVLRAVRKLQQGLDAGTITRG